MAVAHEAVHRRPVRDLDAEDLLARIGMGVEVDESDRAVNRHDRLHVRLGDRMITAEHDRNRTRSDDLPDDALDRCMVSRRIRGHDRGVTEVDDAKLRDRIEARLQVRPGRTARRADGARPEPRPGPVGGEVVHRRSDDRDVDSLELAGSWVAGRPANVSRPA